MFETLNEKIKKIFKEINRNGFNDVTLQHIDELINEIVMKKQFTIDTTSQKHKDWLREAERLLGHPIKPVTWQQAKAQADMVKSWRDNPQRNSLKR